MTAERRVLADVASAIGATEGQLYTLVIGGILAVVLLLTGVMPMRSASGPAPLATAIDAPTGNSEFAPPDLTMPGTAPSAPWPAPQADVPADVIATSPLPVPPTASPPSPAPAQAPPGPSPTPGPLRVVFGRWSTSDLGATTGHPDVPADGLPVGSQLGEDDARSYIRLVGSEHVLTLHEVDDATANRSVASPMILACPITDEAWSIDNGVPHDEAPAWDGDRCTRGARSDDGAWSFDLSTFDDAQRVGSTGFALVPGPTDGSFQVVLARTPPPPT